MRYRISFRPHGSAAALLCAVLALAAPLGAQRRVATSVAETEAEARVTLHLRDVRLQDALTKIGTAGRVDVSFSATTIPADRRVTLDVDDVPVSDALRQVLVGTDIKITHVSGRFALYRENDPQQIEGVIRGRVIESRTRTAVRGASVMIDGKATTVTRDDGTFQVGKVPFGSHATIVRALGFASAERRVVVDSAAPVASMELVLDPVPTTLTEVVTTGAGDRKRVEVGNSIATINADSIVRTTPIRNLSDLLAARVPGVSVLSSSGQVGSASTIRIRGAGSLSSTTDPIVVVDGIRVNGGHKTGFDDHNVSPFGFNASTTSPLNDIDPESIESIDVLRGPSASAMYGSDAANGVIVIKTKRGQAGPTRWNFFGTRTTSHLSETFPDNYFGWGEGLSTDAPGSCGLSLLSFIGPSVAAGTCKPDSVSRFNPLNGKDTSPFAHGSDLQYGGDVRGGTDRMQYYVGGNYTDNVGIVKLPDADYQMLARAQSGQALKDWQQRPNVENGVHVDANLTSHVTSTAELALSTSFLHQYHRTTGDLSGLIYRATQQPGYRDTVAHGWGYAQSTPAALFSTLNSDATDRVIGNLNGTWHPWTWLNGRAVLGADHAVLSTNNLTPRGAFDGSAAGNAGSMGEGNGITRVYSGELGAETAVPLSPRLTWRSSVGGQFNRTQQDVLGTIAQGLAYGSTTAIGAATTFPVESHATSATAGWYVETGIGFAERLFVTGSLRSDKGSAFSSSGGGARFPKLNISWVASQEPLFQRSLGRILPVSNLRLRAAYGQAGVQPDIQARYRTYNAETGNVDGVSSPVSILASLGNTSLAPERSVETEGGFDLGMWNDRLTVEATIYRKVTKDALVNPVLPASFGNRNSRTANLGRVDNRGVELSIGAQPIVSQLATWNLTLTYGTNTNKLVAGKNGDFFGLQRYIVGYPLAGYWDRPILGYADANGNGVIDPSEIQLGDSAVYLGAPYPKAELSLHQTLSLLSGRLALGVGLDMRDHLTQYNQLSTACFSYCRGSVDPTASFAQQVLAQEGINSLYSFILGPGTQYPFVETVSWVRLNELSLTYTLPVRVTSALRARNASVSVMGRNLGMWSKYRGADPEVNTSNDGVRPEMTDDGGLPQPREWSLRFNLGF